MQHNTEEAASHADWQVGIWMSEDWGGSACNEDEDFSYYFEFIIVHTETCKP